ncbi:MULTISPECIES: peptidoglycan D,D-transpeptidase FtsI family protein [Desulfococcus]|uniref:Penicillin-binding protein transpeptidase n=1 Tax=Desulfococcus multivorans DSM 2059 TaxID=1121405 RepID=S7TCD7_DESML|nr:penicillin-binding protein 2 [Desulfococcus multivorans]AQV01746.1 cell division protein FtsI [Desulfococcus multivorans]EPR34200.1 penicillin-binding protein transpeptidase [Desulfococcus multivorans DSM 2059]SKA20061.1 cell division protein FtsI (penicillin-binding protein 3) [Desulfococcus multivorans DSM 2059]
MNWLSPHRIKKRPFPFTKPTEKDYIRLRITLVGCLFAVFFAAIAAKAIYVQIYQGPWLSQKAISEIEKVMTVREKRGVIYDRNHHELAMTIDAVSISAFPRFMKDKSDAAARLSKALGLKADRLKAKLTAGNGFKWIKRKVTPREVRAVRELSIEGIDFVSEHSRYYPQGSLAAQITGFTGVDGRGLEGIEFYYDAQLKGEERKLKVMKDALGKKFGGEREEPFESSARNLVLTVDKTIQYITERALKEAVVEYKAKSGMAVVMNPLTGAVYAIANYPFFNPNAFDQFDRSAYRNRAITDTFEPGSTMKIFSVAAAIEYGGCTPNTIFYCENGKYKVGRFTIHDTHEYGWLSLRKILKFSSNIGAMKMSEMIGAQSLHQTLKNFGFGDPTGIDCPGEAPGALSQYQKWSQVHTGVVSFGHGMSATAIQLAAAVSAIANKGVLMRPYMVSAVTDQKGNVVEAFNPQIMKRAVSEKTAETMKEMMRSVVETGGTGTEADIEGYTVCGKTGTARKVNKDGRYERGSYISSFVGFAPAENPIMTVLVVIDDPQKKYYGGLVAAPAFKKIVRESLNYMDIPPENNMKRLTASLADRHR